MGIASKPGLLSTVRVRRTPGDQRGLTPD
jgi:hypothetical protein